MDTVSPFSLTKKRAPILRIAFWKASESGQFRKPVPETLDFPFVCCFGADEASVPLAFLVLIYCSELYSTQEEARHNLVFSRCKFPRLSEHVAQSLSDVYLIPFACRS